MVELIKDNLNSFKDIIIEAWKSKELRKRIIFTLFILIIYRIGASITIPGVTLNSANASSNGIISSLGLLGGGGLRLYSIFALGVSPYITASIIVQLLSNNVIPYLTNLSKSGEKGRKKLDIINRYLTIILALLQGVGITALMLSTHIISFSNTAVGYVFCLLLLLGGVFFALWLGDQINEKGVGNGISMIILSGVVANIPWNFYNIFKGFLGNSQIITATFVGILESIMMIVFYLLLLFLITFVSQSSQNIPIQNIGSGLVKKGQNQNSYVLLRLTVAGVIPIIFATALVSIPTTVAKFINNSTLTIIIGYIFDRHYPTALICYFILVCLFCFFYSKVTINPERFAENLQKNGSFIPGIQPGFETARYMSKSINSLNFYGALFLGILAVIPYLLLIIFHLPANYGIGGSGMLIFIMVTIDLFSQIKARLQQIRYRQLKEVNKKGFVW